MPKLTLSVAMPNYNHARFLPAAIESVLGQTRPADEFLILDDASTDDSVSIIESYAAREPRIRFERNTKNQGVYAAHQRLFELAQGDFLYGAAADDERFPTFFASAMEMAERFPDCGLVFGEMEVTDTVGKYVSTTKVERWRAPLFASPAEYLRDYLEVEPPMHAATATTIFRRRALEEVGWFRPELGSFADTFAARAIALKYGACYVPELFCKWRRMAGSVSQVTSNEARRSIDLAAAASRLMQTPEFRERFPHDYVHRWLKRHKRQVVWNALLGESYEAAEDRPNFVLRNLRRIARVPRILPLLFYAGK